MVLQHLQIYFCLRPTFEDNDVSAQGSIMVKKQDTIETVVFRFYAKTINR